MSSLLPVLTKWSHCVALNGLETIFVYFRVRTVMENLEKSWNFKMVISRPGKVMGKT